MTNKNITISIVKGLAIILVVYGHVIQRSMVPFNEDFFLNPAFKTIYAFHMPLFVFLSGWVMAYSLSRRSLFSAFKARFNTLMIPFITWGLLSAVLIFVVNIIETESSGLKAFAMSLAYELYLRPTLWILVTLFASSCMLLYSIRLSKRFGKISFLFIYFLVLVIPYNDYGSLFYIKWLYPFYMAGYFISKNDIHVSGWLSRLAVLAISSAAFVFLASYWVKTDYIYIHQMHFMMESWLSDVLRMAYRYVLAFLGITVVFCISVYLSKTGLKHVLDILGIYSLDIYLIQRFVVEGIYPRLVGRMNIKFDFSAPLFLYVIAPLVVVLCVALCMFISNALIRRNYFLNKLLLGGRA